MKRLLSLLLGLSLIALGTAPAAEPPSHVLEPVLESTDSLWGPVYTPADSICYGIVNLSVCNIRLTPEYTAGMDTQALLGTPVHILRWSGPYVWPEIELPDGCTGWVHKDAVTPLSYEDYHAWNSSPKVIVTALWGTVLDAPGKRGRVVTDVVAGARLRLMGRKGKYYKVGLPDGREGYMHKSMGEEECAWRKGLDRSEDAILESALKMNGFPYLWAGTSPKGMDCSGFVRTVLLMHDIIIPRNSGGQAKVGERIIGLDNLRKGDLVFFGRQTEEGPRVSHVGFYLGEGRFIHSLGLVKIGSFRESDPLYDEYNTGRWLFGGRILPYLGKDPKISTTLDGFYSE